MGLHYEEQQVAVLIGSKTSAGTRTSVALTAAYDVANKTKAIEVGGYSKVNFDILYTTGAGETANQIDVRIECSNDGVNYYRIPNETASNGASVLTEREFNFVGSAAATAYAISIGLDIFYKYMRISFKETGVVTNFGTVFCEYTISGK